jgi:hypothetical protein
MKNVIKDKIVNDSGKYRDGTIPHHKKAKHHAENPMIDR